jgi:CelD/BcsL family acetyltransferase involved in cellulose biosynthesis
MQLSIIRSLPEIQTLADEWNLLLKHGASDVPFLRHEYLTTWWLTLGGGEWPQGELYVVAARSSTGELEAVAPLFFTNNLDDQPAMMLLGSIEISDYLDLICPPDRLPAFCAALLEHLAGPQAPAWQVLDLYNLLDTSPTLSALEQAARECGWEFSQEPLKHCPYIPMPGDFEKYLAEQVDKKQRHEIRRKMRRFESYDQPVRWYIVQDETQVDGEMDDFLRLMANDPEKEKFLTSAMRSQMKSVARSAFQAGWLQLSFLEVNGQKAAGYLNFDYANHIWVYNSGLDFSFRELSPGWVLLGYLLQWANENQRGFFDFMRGDEEYKYRFGAIDRRVMRVKIARA